MAASFTLRTALAFGWVLAATSAASVAQTNTPGPVRPSDLQGMQADPPAGLNRIIIGFHPDKAQAASTHGSAPSLRPVDSVQALNQTRHLTTNSGEPVALTYYRSVSSNTHVALTNRRMSRVELSALARQLQRDPQVAYVEVDERVTAQLTPNDTDFAARQWSMQSVADGNGAANFSTAWDSATGAGVIIAQLDGGFRPHADLFANVLAGYGYDFVSADPNGTFTTANDGDGRDSDSRDPGDWSNQGNCTPANSSWHGTHVAGIIAAVGNNNRGVAGGAFNARLLPIRVLGVCGGYVSDIAAAMRWAVGLPVPGVPDNTQVAKVLNLSLGGFGSCSDAFKGAVAEVIATGGVIVAATGNDSARTILQPANCPGVIAVTAHTIDGDNANYANIGTGTVISAPGGGNGSTIVGDGRLIYATSNTGLTTPVADRIEGKSGTSMATAHVSAVVALMFQLKPTITPNEVISRLVNAARPHPAGTYCVGLQTCGAGLLDAGASVGDVLADNAPVVAVRSSAGKVASRGTHVQLTGTALMGLRGLGIQSVAWSQTAGPNVPLTGANTGTASFVVPRDGNSFTFRFSALDQNGKSAHMDLTVPANNTAPVLAPITNQFVLLGAQLTFTVAATDAEDDVVTYVSSTLPRGATLDSATGTFIWDHAGPLGSYTIGVTPGDGLLSGETRYIGITVVAPGSGGGGATHWVEWLILGLLTVLMGFSAKRRRRVPTTALPPVETQPG